MDRSKMRIKTLDFLFSVLNNLLKNCTQHLITLRQRNNRVGKLLESINPAVIIIDVVSKFFKEDEMNCGKKCLEKAVIVLSQYLVSH